MDGGQCNKWCLEWDSLASEVAGYRGAMADSDMIGGEKPEDSELGLKRLEALFIRLAQEMRQGSSAVVERMDLMI